MCREPSPTEGRGRGTLSIAHCAGGGAFTRDGGSHAEGGGAAIAGGGRFGDALNRGAGAFTIAGGGVHARTIAGGGSCALAPASDVGVPLDEVISPQGLMQGSGRCGAPAAAVGNAVGDAVVDAEGWAAAPAAAPAFNAEGLAAAEEAPHGADGMAEIFTRRGRTCSGARAPCAAYKGRPEHAGDACISCSCAYMQCSAMLCSAALPMQRVGGLHAYVPSLLGCRGLCLAGG